MLNRKLFYSWSCYWKWFMIRIGGNKCKCMHSPRIVTFWVLLVCFLTAPHSSTLAWKIPWMEEPGRLQSMGLLRVGHDWATSLFSFHFRALEKEMATHSSVLVWRIPGTEEPGVLLSMGLHRVGHDWSPLATTWRREWLPTPVFWPGEFHGLFHGVTKTRTWLSDFHFT